MSRWRVVSARRSPVSAVVRRLGHHPACSSRSPRGGGIASRQDNSAAESVPSMIGNGDSPGMRPVLTRLGAALCRWESSVGPRPALHLSSRVYPCFVMLLEDCPLLEDCRFDENAYTMPTSMYSTASRCTIGISILGRTQARRELGACLRVGLLPLGGAHVGRDYTARDADVCAIQRSRLTCRGLARSPGRRRGYGRRSAGGAAA